MTRQDKQRLEQIQNHADADMLWVIAQLRMAQTRVINAHAALLKFHPMDSAITRVFSCEKCANYEPCEIADLLSEE